MEDAIRQALKALEKEFGKEIFSNPQQFRGALADAAAGAEGKGYAASWSWWHAT